MPFALRSMPFALRSMPFALSLSKGSDPSIAEEQERFDRLNANEMSIAPLTNR